MKKKCHCAGANEWSFGPKPLDISSRGTMAVRARQSTNARQSLTISNPCSSFLPYNPLLLISLTSGLLSSVRQYFPSLPFPSTDETKRGEEKEERKEKRRKKKGNKAERRKERKRRLVVAEFRKVPRTERDSPKSSWLSLHPAILPRRMFLRHRVTFALRRPVTVRRNKRIEIFEPLLSINASESRLR